MPQWAPTEGPRGILVCVSLPFCWRDMKGRRGQEGCASLDELVPLSQKWASFRQSGFLEKRTQLRSCPSLSCSLPMWYKKAFGRCQPLSLALPSLWTCEKRMPSLYKLPQAMVVCYNREGLKALPAFSCTCFAPPPPLAQQRVKLSCRISPSPWPIPFFLSYNLSCPEYSFLKLIKLLVLPSVRFPSLYI